MPPKHNKTPPGKKKELVAEHQFGSSSRPAQKLGTFWDRILNRYISKRAEGQEEDEEIEDEEDVDYDDDGGNEGEDAEAEAAMELEVEPKQVENLEDVDAVEGNFIDEGVPKEEEEEEEAKADEIEEPVPLDEEHHNLTNVSSYCHDLEGIPSINSHHEDLSTPSGTNNVLPVNTSF